MGLDLHLYEVFAVGYMRSAGGFLTTAEVDSLAAGARLMTLECGVRFLTDYSEEDVYFRIHRPSHNLDRCRTQFQLVADLEDKMVQMQAIVHRTAE